MDNVIIRKTAKEDLPRLLEVFATARSFMARTGNPHQWAEDYPSEALLNDDISKGDSYVVIHDGRIVGTFVLRLGIDPTYKVIYEGNWIDDGPYATIHRIASSGEIGGIFRRTVEFAQHECGYGSIRIDTHKDNKVMQAAIEREGFVYCGIIRCWNGSERMAFQRCLNGKIVV